jgi:integrase
MIKEIKKLIEDKKYLYSEKRIYQYRRALELCQELGNSKPTQSFANKLFQHMLSKGMTNDSAIAYIKPVISALNYCGVSHNIKVKDLLRGVRTSSDDSREYLTSDQLTELYKHNPSSKSLLKVRDLFLWCAYTGMRHNEASRVTLDDVKQLGGIKIVKYSTTKNNKTLEVPLNKACLDILDRWNGLPTLSNSRANKYIHELLDEVGYKETSVRVRYIGGRRVEDVMKLSDKITFHSSRHSFISNLINAGMSVQEVSDLAGVSVQTIIKHYAHSDKETRINKAFEILNK